MISGTDDILDLAHEVVGESVICILSKFSLVKGVVFPKGLIERPGLGIIDGIGMVVIFDDIFGGWQIKRPAHAGLVEGVGKASVTDCALLVSDIGNIWCLV